MSLAPSDVLSLRHHLIREALAQESADALLVTSIPNVAYLSNFEGSSAVVVLTPSRLIFITDSRYVASLEQTVGTARECPGLELVPVKGAYDPTLVHAISGLAPKRLAFEAAHLTVARYQWLVSALSDETRRLEFHATTGLIEGVRVVKDEYELGVLREAGRRLSRAAECVFSDVRAGVTERELALSIDIRIREAGFERTAFETIVASGPNAALPHAKPTERKLSEGDLVVLDFGGVYNSYCVDLTRTVAVGPASPRSREVHAAVLAAHDRAVAAVAPGRSRFAIDQAARDRLAEAGMAEAFGHGTGHGLGLEVHEDPRIARPGPEVDGGREFVTAGMVFTIEPGAYFPGWGGVRIEDDVAVTDGGVELLTHVTTELVEL
jgi:Xaa-Pro aminopeptidase